MFPDSMLILPPRRLWIIVSTAPVVTILRLSRRGLVGARAVVGTVPIVWSIVSIIMRHGSAQKLISASWILKAWWPLLLRSLTHATAGPALPLEPSLLSSTSSLGPNGEGVEQVESCQKCMTSRQHKPYIGWWMCQTQKNHVRCASQVYQSRDNPGGGA